MEHLNENIAVSTVDSSTQATVSPGAMLREARERLGLSVADAAAQTKLAPRQIESLEADDYGNLPEIAFVRGFVRSYAKLLQLDAQPLLAALPKAKTISQVSPDSVDVPFPDAFSPQMQNLMWLGAALFLSVVVVAFAVWHFTSPTSSEQPEPQKQVEAEITLPVQMQVISASAVEEAYASSVASAVPETQSAVSASYPMSAPLAAMPAAKPAQAAVVPKAVPTPPAATPVAKSLPPAVAPTVKSPVPAAPQSTNLRLKFGTESWAEVRDRNGSIISSQMNPAGSELNLQGQGPFTLVVGRATAARLFYKGKPVDLKPYTNAASDVARLSLE